MLWLQNQTVHVQMSVLRKESFTDAELVGSLMERNANDTAIRFLYEEHFELLSRYVINNSGSEQDAEDIFQEVIIAFINLVKAGKFRGESTIKTFLFSLNKNIWLNELKRRGRAMAREEKYEKLNVQSSLTADQLMEIQQTKTDLLKVMDELGENCKKILLLFYYENRSMKEIVDFLPYENEQVVRNKKSKCLKKLEQLVTGNKNLYVQLKNYLNG
ncbi:MAG: sigma-70 family RNA polymerase sigma factor [Flavobacterium sp.]|nr:MAG: sigma-70 family RNA polymerase sigma factor [Flavobacterium sp.]